MYKYTEFNGYLVSYSLSSPNYLLHVKEQDPESLYVKVTVREREG